MGIRTALAGSLRYLVSFRAAYALSLAVPIVLLGWAFVDAQFWHTINTFCGIAGIRPPHTDTLTTAWNYYGDRLVILSLFLLASVTSAIVIVVRLFVGSKDNRSLRAWLLVTLLVGVWCGALIGVIRYPEAQVRYRIARDIWRFQTVADAITNAGKIPTGRIEGGKIVSATWNTDRWPSGFLPNHQLSIHEEVFQIWTLDDGALLFTTLPSLVALEFHPHGTRPSERFSIAKDGFQLGDDLESTEDLGDGWFLVKRSRPSMWPKRLPLVSP
jgi:hypothetical protein